METTDVLGERRASVLRTIIDEYVASAAPVGSQTVLRRARLEVSSATVRNDMAVLEADGYIIQPHTSAGRIPAERGYRWFVDHAARTDRLASEANAAIRHFFADVDTEIERLLLGTSRLLTSLTSLAAIVLAPQWEDARLASVHLTMLDARRLLIVLITRTGRVVKVSIDTDEDIAADRLGIAAEVLNRSLVGTPAWRLGRIAAEHPDPDVAALLVSVRDGLARVAAAERADTAADVFVGGTSHLAESVVAPLELREVLEFLEEQQHLSEVLQSLVEGGGRGVVVRLGSELPDLPAMSVVVAPYSVAGAGSCGVVGILGPLRMDYAQAMSAVHAVSGRLEATLHPED